MEILSINSEATVSPQRIGLNVSEELTPELISRIDYGTLRFTGSGRVLVVHIPAGSDEPFTEHSVNTLKGKIANAEAELLEKRIKRERMLRAISHQTGLRLD